MRQKLTTQNRAQIQMLIPDSVDFRLQSGLHPMRHFPGMVVVHFDSIKVGLRFPLHPFFVSLLNFYNVVPAQIMPNSYRSIAGFICRCHSVNVIPTLELFHYFFSVIPQQSHGFLVVSSRPGHILFCEAPSSIKGWKDRFFFVSVPNGLIPRKWNAFPPKSPEPFISEELSKDVIAVEAGGCFKIMSYLTPKRLIKAGIALKQGETSDSEGANPEQPAMDDSRLFTFGFDDEPPTSPPKQQRKTKRKRLRKADQGTSS
ncbi:unnamed protein product, partial [Cuscuta epithymum]